MDSNSDIYRKLQKHIDGMPVGFPQSPSGRDIKLLKHLFTPEEAEVALQLSAFPESLERIHKRVKKAGMSKEQLEQTLDRLVSKGAIMNATRHVKNGTGKYYSKAMMVVGMFELQVERLKKEFAEDFMAYLEEGFYKEVTTLKTPQMRTIPISQNVTQDKFIASYDDGRTIINNSSGRIVLMDCVCRDGKDLIGSPCKQSDIRDTCMVLESTADMIHDLGRGRTITKTQALAVIQRAEDNGFILQPSNNQKPHFLCSCCGCCCELIKSLKMRAKPSAYCHSNYIAEIVTETCTGCGACTRICPMEAITLAGGKAVVNHDRCIGCGACVSKCVFDSAALKKKTTQYIPPRNIFAMYRQILVEKFGILGVLKIISKVLVGGKA